jgi:N-methylhydantoinase B
MNVIDYNDSLLNAPYGVLRGTAGAGGGSYVEGHDGRRRFLGPVVETTVTPGELWVGVSTGGGGYGDPLARDALRVRADVLDGLYSRGVALKVFGVLLSEGPEAELDADATGDLRERLLAAQSESQTRVSSTHPAGAAWVARVSREGDEIPPILAGLVTRVPKENLS